MTFLRALAALLSGILLTAACLGFAFARSLDDPDPFVARMDEALTDPAVAAEVKSVVRSQVLAAGERLAAGAGPLAELARSGAQSAADEIAAEVDSEQFRVAWSSWAELLYDGLTAAAAGAADPQVSVAGSDITVEIEPLVAPLLGASLAGDLTGVLQVLGRDTGVTITTEVPLQRILRAIDQLAQLRWPLVIAGAGALALTALAGPRRRAWLAGALLWSSVCLAAAGSLLLLRASVSPPGSDFPELSRAVTSALTAPWSSLLLTAAAVGVVLGVVMVVVALVPTRRSSP